MRQIRHRDSAEIRAPARETAEQAPAFGCASAEFDLDVPPTHPHAAGPERRRFFRLAAIALAVVLVCNVLLSGQALAATKPITGESDSSGPSAGYFGVDSCTSLPRAMVAGMPLHYYIGELGATQYNARCFDVKTAAHATAAYTHGYWGVSGPNAMPSGMSDPGVWGERQALAAIDAWNNNPHIGGRTIFADVESGFGGWGKPATQADNVALLNGFLQTLTQTGFIPGVYVNRSEREAWFPADYVAPVPFVYWVAGGTMAGTMAGPCQPGDTMGVTAAAWTSSVQHEMFGGMQAVVWQYWLSGMGCGGDYNYSPQTGYSLFTPLPVPPPTPASGADGTPTPTPIATSTPSDGN